MSQQSRHSLFTKTRASRLFSTFYSPLFSLLFGFMFISVAATPAFAEKEDLYKQLDLMANVFERVRANYVEEVEDEKLIEAAISGMLSDLDPHSAYMPPKSFDQMQEQTTGEFGGLGIEVTMEKGLVKIVSPIEDTPASRAGLQSGDLIIQIDGEDVQGISLSEAVEKMRGKVGEKIDLRILREDEQKTFNVTIVRDKIKIRSVRWHMEDSGIGYVRITTFNEQVEEMLPTALKELREENDGDLKGMVLDLRNNPGGLLSQAIYLSDAFLDKGEIVSTKGRHSEQDQINHAEKGDLLNGKPIVVLVNGGSASASEIVAGALQDHKRGIVAGTKSFGKGSVQTVINLPEGAGMRLTTALYYTPSGRSIQAKGIEPDIHIPVAEVKEKNDDEGYRRSEASLRGHLSNADDDAAQENEETKNGENKNQKKTTDDKEEDEERPFDYQLDRALGIAKAMSIWQQE